MPGRALVSLLRRNDTDPKLGTLVQGNVRDSRPSQPLEWTSTTVPCLEPCQRPPWPQTDVGLLRGLGGVQSSRCSTSRGASAVRSFHRASAARCRRPLAAGRGHCGVGTRSPAATAHRRSSHALGRPPTDVLCVVRRSVMVWTQSNFVEDVSASPSRASAIGPRRKTSSC